MPITSKPFFVLCWGVLARHSLSTNSGSFYCVQEHVFLSSDRVADADHAALYSVEFLNTLTPSGLPPHKLVLKVGMPIMLLRNICPAQGLANGTRLVCRGFSRRVIDAEIISGSHVGDRVFIPRVMMQPSDPDLPFNLQRCQFPIRPAFAMTINKSQGQTMAKVGLFLPKPVFSHGQLYVAYSRTGARSNVIVIVAERGDRAGHLTAANAQGVYTRNVVYQEVLSA
jgi:ATP-dependent DNA helicase PIF1